MRVKVYVTGGYRIRPYGILRRFRAIIEITCRFSLRTHAHGQPTVCSANEGQPLRDSEKISCGDGDDVELMGEHSNTR